MMDDREMAEFLGSYYARLGHPYIGKSNNLATVLGFFVLLVLAYACFRRNVQSYAIAGLTIAAIVATLSRGVVLALAIAGIVFLAVNRRIAVRAAMAASLAIMLVVGGSVLIFQENPEWGGWIVLGDRMERKNIDARVEKVDMALTKIEARPLLGYGGGVVADGEVLLDGGVHNTVVEQFLYYGIPIGLVVVMALVVLAIRVAQWPASGPEGKSLARAVGVGILGQFLIFLVQSSYEGTLLRVLFYFSVGLAVAMLRASDSGASRYSVRRCEVGS
jgi:O-antigen ligase